MATPNEAGRRAEQLRLLANAVSDFRAVVARVKTIVGDGNTIQVLIGLVAESCDAGAQLLTEVDTLITTTESADAGEEDEEEYDQNDEEQEQEEEVPETPTPASKTKGKAPKKAPATVHLPVVLSSADAKRIGVAGGTKGAPPNGTKRKASHNNPIPVPQAKKKKGAKTGDKGV